MHGKNTKMSARALYYNPENPSAFSTVNKLSAALPMKNKSGVTTGLNTKTYTLCISLSGRDSYAIPKLSNVMDVLECDLLDMWSLAKFNDMYRYILSVIDVFLKYLHLVPVKTKIGPTITSAF